MGPTGKNPSPETAAAKLQLQDLTADDLLQMYYLMLLTRALDERAWLLSRAGKVAFIVSCQGHEAAQIGSAYAIRRGHDRVFPYYRDMGVHLTLGVTPRQYMLGILARRDDPFSGGRHMPGHGGIPALGTTSRASVVGSHLTQAAGAALASKIKGDDAVTLCYFSDGATSEGDFHEAMNFAGIHKLPLLFICENNQYAISVPVSKQSATQDIADRAKAYGFPGVVVDGFDPLAVYRVVKKAVDRARNGGGPTLIEAKVYRFLPHSSEDDDTAYRSREEVAIWRAKDPLPRFKKLLMDEGILREEKDKELRERVTAEVDDATEFAEASPEPIAEDLFNHVYADKDSGG